MDIIKRLNVLRLERNMSVYRLSELSGINQSTLANTFSRGTVPSVENLERICEAFGITLSQFFATGETSARLTDGETALVENYRKLSVGMKTVVDELMKKIVEEKAQ